MKMYVDLFKSKGDKTTCTISYNGKMVMYHGKDMSYYVNKILDEAKDCNEIFVDPRGLSGCLYDYLKKADSKNRVKELQILRENEKDSIDKIFEILNFDRNKMPTFQEVIRVFATKWKKFNEEEKDICMKILSKEFKNKILNDIEDGFNFKNKTLEVELTPNQISENKCATISIKKDVVEESCNNKLTIPVRFLIKEIRCNSNYKTDNFYSDCPIVIDESVDGFEFVIGLSTDSEELKTNKKGFKITRKHFKNSLIEKAQQLIGIPYAWGGENPSEGFDCSGLVQYVYKQMNLKLPRSTYDQIKLGQDIELNNIEIGDVVFFTEGNHNGIYIGNNKYIHAPHIGKKVCISSLNNNCNLYKIKRYF